MKSILNSKLIVLVKRNKNKKFRVKFRFYRLEKDGVTELTSMDRSIPKCGEVFKHFKGNCYKILAVGHHSETKEKLVVYFDLSGKNKGCTFSRT